MVQNGLSDLSLRPLAAAVGVSPRTLLYHFGSKEQLIAEALRPQRTRAPGADPEARRGLERELDEYWDWLVSDDAAPFMRLFFEVYALALRDPDRFPAFLETVTGDWLPYLAERAREAGLPPKRAEATATLMLATYRGLSLDLLATGDRQRAENAHRELKRVLGVKRARGSKK